MTYVLFIKLYNSYLIIYILFISDNKMPPKNLVQERQCMYNVKLWCISVATVEKE